ncbi:PREDICTED: taste receptor type 2 member 1-like [Elephantulus edwardii]|uniref:taste receptor type 2 member 1-like n=1 Tax=Elephantulus edwardii TaxID=28737 RepID=UPI0003F0AC0F|nr:PREDICTED: taste receptor type 2 member 1-like [Elephantulus edwardii]
MLPKPRAQVNKVGALVIEGALKSVVTCVSQLLSGILANAAILAGVCVDVVKRRRWNSLDLLFSCLASSRIFLQVIVFYNCLVLVFVVGPGEIERNFLVCIFISELSLWLATWLGVFYCVKVATVACPLSLWLKRRISALVPWLILVSLLFAALDAIGHDRYTRGLLQEALFFYSLKNSTRQSMELTTAFVFLLTGFCLPLLIFLGAALTLVVSLGRHMRQMCRLGGAGDPPKHSPSGALLSILCFLFLFVFHYVVGFLLSARVFPDVVSMSADPGPAQEPGADGDRASHTSSREKGLSTHAAPPLPASPPPWRDYSVEKNIMLGVGKGEDTVSQADCHRDCSNGLDAGQEGTSSSSLDIPQQTCCHLCAVTFSQAYHPSREQLSERPATLCPKS